MVANVRSMIPMVAKQLPCNTVNFPIEIPSWKYSTRKNKLKFRSVPYFSASWFYWRIRFSVARAKWLYINIDMNINVHIPAAYPHITANNVTSHHTPRMTCCTRHWSCLLLGCTLHGRVVDGHIQQYLYGLVVQRSLTVLRPDQAFMMISYVSVAYCSRFCR